MILIAGPYRSGTGDDPAKMAKNVEAMEEFALPLFRAGHIPIVGDAMNILAKLVAEYRALEPDPGRLEEWWQRIRAWQDKYPLRYDDSEDGEIKPQFMIQALYEATGGEGIVTSDIGQHQMWAAQYFHFSKPRKWINSGGLGTMGFGLPAAMGAKAGCPDELVVCIRGAEPARWPLARDIEGLRIFWVGAAEIILGPAPLQPKMRVSWRVSRSPVGSVANESGRKSGITSAAPACVPGPRPCWCGRRRTGAPAPPPPRSRRPPPRTRPRSALAGRSHPGG